MTREQLISTIIEETAKAGYSVYEVLGVGPKKIAYRERDSINIWSGRGRKPLWLKNHLAAGRQIDEFLISV
jgi:DNA-binding protein H-NS